MHNNSDRKKYREAKNKDAVTKNLYENFDNSDLEKVLNNEEPVINHVPEKGFFSLSNEMHYILQTMSYIKASHDKKAGIKMPPNQAQYEKTEDYARACTNHQIASKFRGLRFGKTHVKNWKKDK